MSLHGYKKKWKRRDYLGPAAENAQARLDAAQAMSAIKSLARRTNATEYRRLAKEFVRQASLRGVCPVWAGIPELRDGVKYGCAISNRIAEVHHMRGRRGNLLCNQKYWLAVSRQGHRWIHSHPTLARERGWLAQVGDWNKQDDERK